jgi:methylthioribulose-1-phosphate dehydratase
VALATTIVIYLDSSMETEFELRAKELIEAGRVIHARGWVPATSGNFSARLTDGTIAVTVSGKNKGTLTLDQIMRVDSSGRSMDGKKPSAEVDLHTGIYNRYPEVRAILHPHSPASTLMSKLFKDSVHLEGYELLKALNGVMTHEAKITLPIFPNDQNIPRLASKVDSYINQFGDIFGYVISGHGFYTWGTSVEEALRHLEALEFLFEIETKLHGVKWG